jgi:hypothetical protein
MQAMRGDRQEITMASRSDQQCGMLDTFPPPLAPGLPHIANAEIACTTASAKATDVSHAFACGVTAHQVQRGDHATASVFASG